MLMLDSGLGLERPGLGTLPLPLLPHAVSLDPYHGGQQRRIHWGHQRHVDAEESVPRRVLHGRAAAPAPTGEGTGLVDLPEMQVGRDQGADERTASHELSPGKAEKFGSRSRLGVWGHSGER